MKKDNKVETLADILAEEEAGINECGECVYLTPEEAQELKICFINESARRYGKVNRDAPLYRKLAKLAPGVKE